MSVNRLPGLEWANLICSSYFKVDHVIAIALWFLPTQTQWQSCTIPLPCKKSPCLDSPLNVSLISFPKYSPLSPTSSLISFFAFGRMRLIFQSSSKRKMVDVVFLVLYKLAWICNFHWHDLFSLCQRGKRKKAFSQTHCLKQGHKSSFDEWSQMRWSWLRYLTNQALPRLMAEFISNWRLLFEKSP